MKSLCRAVALILAVSSLARAQSMDIRQTGDYTLRTGDSPDTARQLASLDADRKALGGVAAFLAGLPSMKSLGLTESELAAYLAGILELPEPKNDGDGRVFKSEVSFRLDAADVVRQLEGVHQDSEVSRDLIATALRTRQLRDQLAGEPSVTAMRKLQSNRLLAQARAALMRQEIGTTSVPVTSEAGRRRARQLVDRAMVLDPASADAYRVVGDVLLEEGDPAGAEREFRRVLKENPNSGLDRNKLGNALFSQGKASEAEAEFKEAIRLNPADFISHSDLGLTLRQQRYPAATAAFREAIRINPRYVDGHNNLGLALAGEGRTPESLAEFQEVIRLRPNSALGHFNAATALADMEKDEESTKALREAVRLNPNHHNAHYNLGEMLRLTGNLVESAKEFREYVNRAPDGPRTQRNKERARSFIKAFEEP